MLIRRAPRFTASEITDPKLYLSRRELISGAAATLVLSPGLGTAATPATPALQPLAATRNAAFSSSEPATKVEAATTYNNFYEFGVNKDDPARLGHTLRPRPWTVQVDGLVSTPKTFDIEELIKLFPLEEAVRKMSGGVAARLGLRDRGLLREGMFADVVVFDDATIIDLATPEKPHQVSRGVEQVFVNGVQVVKDGKHTGATPGRVLTGSGN